MQASLKVKVGNGIARPPYAWMKVAGSSRHLADSTEDRLYPADIAVIYICTVHLYVVEMVFFDDVKPRNMIE